MVTILLGSALIIQLNSPNSRPLEILYLSIIISYAFTAITLSLLRRIENLRQYAYFQIIYDLLFETGMVAISGGVESIFTFTYIFTIIAAGILLFRRGAFLSASLSAILYGLLVALQFYRILPSFLSLQVHFSPVNVSEIYYNIFLNSCAFYLVAFLSSYLSESLRKTSQRLWETSHDLNELQAFHHNILQGLQSGVLTTDLYGNITSYNRAAELITGFTLSEVYGKNLQWLFPDFHITSFLDLSSDLYRKARRLETVIIKKAGSKVYLGLSLSLFHDNAGKVSGVICIFQDLTELREMQEQVARTDRLAAIGELAAGVAHEIRNPLASISGATQMLRPELDLSGEQKVLMDIIVHESKRLDRLLSDFLLYARPQSLTFAESDLIRDVILATVESLQHDERFLKDKITIRVDAPPDLPKITCDAQQLQQACWNFCLNAFQAMPQGGTLLIRAFLDTIDGWNPGMHRQTQVCVISFCDDGVGMEDEVLHNLFHPFYTTKKHGTGLGLAITHTIVKNHHGMIRVKSIPNEGTTFDVILPVNQEYLSGQSDE